MSRSPSCPYSPQKIATVLFYQRHADPAVDALLLGGVGPPGQAGPAHEFSVSGVEYDPFLAVARGRDHCPHVLSIGRNENRAVLAAGHGQRPFPGGLSGRDDLVGRTEHRRAQIWRERVIAHSGRRNAKVRCRPLVTGQQRVEVEYLKPVGLRQADQNPAIGPDDAMPVADDPVRLGPLHAADQPCFKLHDDHPARPGRSGPRDGANRTIGDPFGQPVGDAKGQNRVPSAGESGVSSWTPRTRTTLRSNGSAGSPSCPGISPSIPAS